jgi:hypothetical protein
LQAAQRREKPRSKVDSPGFSRYMPRQLRARLLIGALLIVTQPA